MTNLPEVIYWHGKGWYASNQEGNYENTRIVTRWYGSDPDEQPDTYGSAGTPFWYESPQAQNPDVRVEWVPIPFPLDKKLPEGYKFTVVDKDGGIHNATAYGPNKGFNVEDDEEVGDLVGWYY